MNAWEVISRHVVWNPGFTIQFQDWETVLRKLLRRLQVLRKCSEDENKLIQKVSTNGNFSVKSFYSFSESNGGVSFLSKVVWGSWAPLKVGFFFFLLGRLFRKGS